MERTQLERALGKEIDPAFARRARIILKSLDLEPGMAVLDLGCGRGFYSKVISGMVPGLSVVGVDYVEKYLPKGSGRGAWFVRAGAEALPFGDGSFDRVVCSEVLEHVADDVGVIAEIRRVLRRGGVGLFSVPSRDYPFLWDPLNFSLERLSGRHVPSHIWWLAGIWADHRRLYDGRELTEKLERNGLAVRRTWHATSVCLPFSHFLLYGVGKNLVEKGLVGDAFSRFHLESRPSPLVRLAQGLFRLADRFNQEDDRGRTRHVNLVARAEKLDT